MRNNYLKPLCSYPRCTFNTLKAISFYLIGFEFSKLLKIPEKKSFSGEIHKEAFSTLSYVTGTIFMKENRGIILKIHILQSRVVPAIIIYKRI